MKRESRLKVLLPAAVIAGLLGAVIALALAGSGATNTVTVYRGSGTASSGAPGSGSTIPTSFGTGTTKGLTINQVYRMDSPGVVDILVTSEQTSPGLGGIFGGGGTIQKTQAEGAGVVYNSSGDIVTDEHVVAGANSITVNFQDGQSAKATLIGKDASTDTAVIHVNVPASQLHPLKFANSNAAQVGDPVIAIGSPFSQPWTTTQGIVSQVGRSITAPNNFTITGAIQTDAAINPGNSGGPLIDAAGQVLGLADQIETNTTGSNGEGQSSGVGFAVPSNTVVHEANGFIAGHPVQHSYVGVCLNSDTTGSAGAQIAPTGCNGSPTAIAAGSPAARAGLQPNDTIIAINGQRITTTEQFITTVAGYPPGRTITLTVRRGGRTLQVHLTLGKRPANASTG
jgi:putative serine protease PepD